MSSDDFKKAAQNSNLISGIYNYCNRWCEKCNFTNRCMLASVENANNQKDEKNIFENIKKSFEIATELLNEWAEKEGMKLDKILENTEAKDFQEAFDEVNNHPLNKESKTYIKKIDHFLQHHKEAINLEQENLIDQIQQEIISTNSLAEIEDVQNALAVVEWYAYQIHTKLITAINGMEFDPAYEDEIQNHGNGSAKVALLGTEETIGAMGILLQSFPEYQDEILPILAQLARIRKFIKHYFPKAEQFKRPGFDE